MPEPRSPASSPRSALAAEVPTAAAPPTAWRRLVVLACLVLAAWAAAIAWQGRQVELARVQAELDGRVVLSGVARIWAAAERSRQADPATGAAGARPALTLDEAWADGRPWIERWQGPGGSAGPDGLAATRQAWLAALADVRGRLLQVPAEARPLDPGLRDALAHFGRATESLMQAQVDQASAPTAAGRHPSPVVLLALGLLGLLWVGADGWRHEGSRTRPGRGRSDPSGNADPPARRADPAPGAILPVVPMLPREPAMAAGWAVAPAADPTRPSLHQRLARTLALAASPAGDRFALVALRVRPDAEALAELPAEASALLASAVARRLQALLQPAEGLLWRTDPGAGPLALVLIDELTPEASAALPARLRSWRAELAEPYTVADHPVRVFAALGVVDTALDPAAAAAIAPAADPVQALIDTASALADHVLDAPDGAGAAADPRSTFGVAFHSAAWAAQCAERQRVDAQLARLTEPGALTVCLRPVSALGDGTPAGWLSTFRLDGPADPADAAGAVTDGPLGAVLRGVGPAGRRRLAETLWTQALRALDLQDPTGTDSWVAVPVPAGLWQDGTLASVVQAACRQAGMPPSRLDLHLEESALSAAPEAVAGPLDAVRAIGARVTLVGLSQGSASLSWLSRLPLSAVRLDAPLVHDLPLRETAHLLVRAIVQLAAERRQLVWAEAADSAAVRRALRDAGVTWVDAETAAGAAAPVATGTLRSPAAPAPAPGRFPAAGRRGQPAPSA